MRLLMTTDTVGGVWTFTKELSEALLHGSDEVTLVSFGRAPSREQHGWAQDTEDLWPKSFRFVPTDLPLEWMQNNSDLYPAAGALLLQLIESLQPEMLHLNQFCFGALPTHLPKIVTAHSDVLSWWSSCRGALSEMKEDRWLETYKDLVRRGLDGADHVTAPTCWMLDQIAALYGAPRSSSVVFNGRSLKRKQGGERRVQAVTAGRLWDEAKNISMLQQVSGSIPILVAGDSSFEGNAVLDSPRLQFLGSLSESAMLQLFRESSLYIVTSRYEPFGLAPVEAALCGCAILVNDIPSLREVWGDAAIYFSGAAALSCILAALSDDPTELRRAAERSFRHASLHYTRERMASAYLRLYSSMMGEARHVA